MNYIVSFESQTILVNYSSYDMQFSPQLLVKTCGFAPSHYSNHAVQPLGMSEP